MTSQQLQTKELIEAKMSELMDGLTQDNARTIWSRIDDSRFQELMSVLIRMYAAKAQTGMEVIPVSKAQLNQTETSIFVDQLLKYMDIELFELQMWRSLGSNY